MMNIKSSFYAYDRTGLAQRLLRTTIPWEFDGLYPSGGSNRGRSPVPFFPMI